MRKVRNKVAGTIGEAFLSYDRYVYMKSYSACSMIFVRISSYDTIAYSFGITYARHCEAFHLFESTPSPNITMLP